MDDPAEVESVSSECTVDILMFPSRARPETTRRIRYHLLELCYSLQWKFNHRKSYYTYCQ